ncbi:transmembrane protein 182-like [Halichoeres trimaculatus]|uniref:transmembrane protein 182-like n=1 Tax=Halichoeres trimaculatus TaxID=147232 RepID=UPI003D9DB49E
MTPAERLKVLVFLSFFFGASGFLFTLLSCGTEYWLLAAETCSRRDEASDGVRVFHEGLFWRCSFTAHSQDFSFWDAWFSNQLSSKLCQAAFLFPFPVYEAPHGSSSEEYERSSAIVFRTFWSIFLILGSMSVVIGGFVVVCAGPLSNQKLYKVGGALQLSGGVCLLAVVLMYLMWIQVLDTLEQFVLHQRASSCPSFHLSIQLGPSFLLAPVAAFSCLLAGLLSLLVGRGLQDVQGCKNLVFHTYEPEPAGATLGCHMGSGCPGWQSGAEALREGIISNRHRLFDEGDGAEWGGGEEVERGKRRAWSMEYNFRAQIPKQTAQQQQEQQEQQPPRHAERHQDNGKGGSSGGDTCDA